MSKTQHCVGIGAALAAIFALTLPTTADAQMMVGPARRIQGSPVAAQAVRARFVWGAGGDRIVYVNEADEVFYHRLQGNRVMPHIRMRGHTIGVRGDRTRYVVPWATNQILVVTGSGSVYRHNIRSESIGPPEQIAGAPVATSAQEPVFMFRVRNRLINVTRQGEIWAHVIGNTVSPPQRIGTHAIASPVQVRHVWNIGPTVFIITDQGAIYAHHVHPNFGRARTIRSSTMELGQPSTRFVFPLGNALFAVNERGEMWKHDISRLIQAERARGGR